MIGGTEQYGDNDDAFRIDDFSSSQVEGSLTLSDVDYDFAASNCGEFSYEGRSAPAETAAQQQRAPRAEPAAAPSWKLWFR